MTASDIFSATKEKVVIYWLVGVYVLFFSFSGLASCLLAALIGTTWNTMDTQGKIMIILVVFVNWSTIMLAFMNKALTRIVSGQLPISSDDSQLLSQKTSVQQQTVQQINDSPIVVTTTESKTNEIKTNTPIPTNSSSTQFSSPHE